MIDPNIIFSIRSDSEFESAALEVFRFQSRNCQVYADFVDHLGVRPASVSRIAEIPFMPIGFFKTRDVRVGEGTPEVVFSSSGTTGMQQSIHRVVDLSLYERSYLEAFRLFYGDIEDYTLLALLPSYQEREGSSLIYMIDDLIGKTRNVNSGYYLYDHQELEDKLNTLRENRQPTILIGVTYALLDFAESRSLEFPELIVMETGGMKGKRKEMIRPELHEVLCAGFGVPVIHSEYGMTELLSQAYSKGGGLFHCPPWMKILTRETNDPLSLLKAGQTGGINIIDLANLHSCAFLATQDLGKVFEDGSFEVLGRFDNSDVRGCNLLVQ